MSNNVEENEPVAPAPGTHEPFSDWFLQDLVDVANNSESGDFIGITLNVGGFLISGTLISGRQYFTDLANAMTPDASDDDKEAVDGIRRFFSEYGEVYQPRKENEEPDSSRVRFIHLKDAKFFQPGGSPIPANQGTLWRGQVYAVNGFFLGTIGGIGS